MSTMIKTHKANNASLMIALVISAVIALAVAFYLTTTGKADAAEQAAPVAAEQAAPAVEAPPAVH